MNSEKKARRALGALGLLTPRPAEGAAENLAERHRQDLLKRAYRMFLPSELSVAMAAFHSAVGRPLRGIQIGANDGRKSGDPAYQIFHDYFDEIVLVEPQPHLIPILREHYSQYKGKAHIEQLAIGTAPIIQLNIPTLPMQKIYAEKVGRDVSAIVSSDRDYVIKLLTKRTGLDAAFVNDNVILTDIPGMTLAGLVGKYGMENLDFLQVDCEGYDWVVLSTLGACRPKIINFESDKLSDEHWTAWTEFADANGYGYVRGRQDTFAILGAKFS